MKALHPQFKMENSGGVSLRELLRDYAVCTKKLFQQSCFKPTVCFMKESKIVIYDSMGYYPLSVAEKLRQLAELATDSPYNSWSIERLPKCPRQTNSSDCGVCMCAYASRVVCNRDFDVSQNDITKFRVKMVAELRKGEIDL